MIRFVRVLLLNQKQKCFDEKYQHHPLRTNIIHAIIAQQHDVTGKIGVVLHLNAIHDCTKNPPRHLTRRLKAQFHL